MDQATNQIDPNIPNPCVAGSLDYFPSPTDANSYIQCNNFLEAFLMHCPSGEVWKQALKACDNP